MNEAAHAVSDPTRREILQLVRDEEKTVTEIASHFTVTRPAISQHLRVLTEADLVTVRPDGNRRYYRARPEGMADLRTWLDGFWRTSLRNLKVEVEREAWNTRAATSKSKTSKTTASKTTASKTDTNTDEHEGNDE